jgi:hypothetical protein
MGGDVRASYTDEEHTVWKMKNVALRVGLSKICCCTASDGACVVVEEKEAAMFSPGG